ncbi:MAG TPA: hypothetical protein VHR86_09500, partial [Armatimonadota bacterium]|nr:hypothetical protein [Armatimonadota bacterium]
MSLLDRIANKCAAQNPEPEWKPEPPVTESIPAPAAPAFPPPAAPSSGMRLDMLVWMLRDRICTAFETAGPVTTVVERAERDQRLHAIDEQINPILQQEIEPLTPTERVKVST